AKAKVEHEFDEDHLNIFVTFRFAMETTSDPLADEVDHDVMPPLNLWLLEADEVAVDITASAWQDQFTLLLTSDTIVAYPDRVTLEYDGPHEKLHIIWDKQWEPWGPILSTDIGRKDAYADRGDPAVYDYDKDDLTIDGAWHEMDLSGIVSEKATAVFIIGHLKGAGADWHIMFRKNGNVNEVNHGGMETLRANVERRRSSIV
ncbi:unnamed protein product, partial [marine sediment metagenome]